MHLRRGSVQRNSVLIVLILVAVAAAAAVVIILPAEQPPEEFLGLLHADVDATTAATTTHQQNEEHGAGHADRRVANRPAVVVERVVVVFVGPLIETLGFAHFTAKRGSNLLFVGGFGVDFGQLAVLQSVLRGQVGYVLLGGRVKTGEFVQRRRSDYIVVVVVVDVRCGVVVVTVFIVVAVVVIVVDNYSCIRFIFFVFDGQNPVKR